MSDLSLIETLRHEPGTGFIRLDRHLARLTSSAHALSIPGSEGAEAALRDHPESGHPLRIRLELFADGRIEVTSAPITPLPDGTVWRAALAETPLSSADPLLVHKTSRRQAYDAARAEFDRAVIDEVIMLNERGEICEGTITSVFLPAADGKLVTPPLSAGLLAGVLRGELIETGKAREGRILPGDLAGITFYLGNSLRGLIAARLS